MSTLPAGCTVSESVGPGTSSSVYCGLENIARVHADRTEEDA
jgi:hypothetical protein